jgi:fermentation-respiration switch protein FrsA (DUF1100 family)
MQRALALSVISLAAFGGLAACGSTPPEHGPQPVGHFGVGFVIEKLVDASRPTPSTPKAKGHSGRTLITTIFYPSSSVPSGNTKGGVPGDAADGPYPLIVFAHGFGGSPASYSATLEAWASAGYVVAAPLFPLTGSDAPGGPNLSDYVNQPGDMSFVIDSVLHSSAVARGSSSTRGAGAHGANGSGSPISGLVDPRHIGAAGHSLGGVTTLGLVANSCCIDSRVSAAVVMSGDPITFPNGQADFGSAPPLLLVHGDADQTVPYSSSVDAFNSAHPPKGLLTILGGGHGSPVDQTGPEFATIVDVTVSFFDLYLKHDAAARPVLQSSSPSSGTRLVFAFDAKHNLTLPVPKGPGGKLHASATPSQGLTDGETVTVVWSGYDPKSSLNIIECSSSLPTSANDCDLTTAKLLLADPKGAGSIPFVVHTGPIGTGTCDAAHDTCVIVVNQGGSTASSANTLLHISFAR